MSEAPILILACIAGGALGVIFFGGLWWTVRKAMSSPHPALWFTSSILLRMGLTLSGVYVISAGLWPRLLACLIGFTIARAAVTWLTRPSPSEKVGYAAHP